MRSKQDGILWGSDNLGTPVVLFNPHPYPVLGTAVMRGRLGSAVDTHGEPVFAQQIRAEHTNGTDYTDTLFQAEVPALGYRPLIVKFRYLA